MELLWDWRTFEPMEFELVLEFVLDSNSTMFVFGWKFSFANSGTGEIRYIQNTNILGDIYYHMVYQSK